MTFHDKYVEKCNTVSDINEHLPKLYELACNCSSIVELGVGYGVSTTAFIASLEKTGGTLESWDLVALSGVIDLFDAALTDGLAVRLHLQNTLEAKFSHADMLLVDSKHDYAQVRDELLLHGNNIGKYIAFHDTVSFGDHDEYGGGPGILPAIREWMTANPHWAPVWDAQNNNGLLVLTRS